METGCRTCATRPTGSAPGSPARHVSPGKPFEECPACGAYVERAGFREWATMAAPLKARNVLRCLWLGLLAGCLTGAGYALWALVAARGPTLVGCGAGFGVGFVLAASWQGFWLGEAIQRSRRRMTDPMYTARLMEFELERVGADATAGTDS